MIASRRRMLSFLGAAPLAARSAADATFGRLAGLAASDGMGNASLGIPTTAAPPGLGDGGALNQYVPFEKRAIAVSDLIRLTGIPEVVDFKLRDDARYVHCLDPDIACKRSWSMNVKIAAQRERNYERAVERMRRAGTHFRGLSLLKSTLGFEWPW